MSNPRNLIDLAALSDPTDTHSLAELRAHLEDGGDIQSADVTLDTILANPVHECDNCDWEDGPHACPCCGVVHDVPDDIMSDRRSGGDGA